MPLWRQGDVLIQTVDELPDGLVPMKGLVLAAGEVTGHRHRIENPRSARLHARPLARAVLREIFLEVLHDTADVIHPEHGTITLPFGYYRVWQQREAGPWGDRTVQD